MNDEKKFDNLKWIRVFTPVHIPKYLVEQVKERTYEVDDFYKFQEVACVQTYENGVQLNPYNHLYVLANEENLTKGFVWFTVDPLSKDVCIHTYSLDNEYWFKNRAVEKLANFIKEFRKKGNLNRVFWISKYPKHQERYGFKRSKHVLMEYTEEENGKHSISGSSRGITSSIRSIETGSEDSIRRNPTGKKHRTADTGTTTIPTRSGPSRSGRTSGSSLQPVSSTT